MDLNEWCGDIEKLKVDWNKWVSKRNGCRMKLSGSTDDIFDNVISRKHQKLNKLMPSIYVEYPLPDIGMDMDVKKFIDQRRVSHSIDSIGMLAGSIVARCGEREGREEIGKAFEELIDVFEGSIDSVIDKPNKMSWTKKVHRKLAKIDAAIKDRCKSHYTRYAFLHGYSDIREHIDRIKRELEKTAYFKKIKQPVFCVSARPHDFMMLGYHECDKGSCYKAGREFMKAPFVIMNNRESVVYYIRDKASDRVVSRAWGLYLGKHDIIMANVYPNHQNFIDMMNESASVIVPDHGQYGVDFDPDDNRNLYVNDDVTRIISFDGTTHTYHLEMNNTPYPIGRCDEYLCHDCGTPMDSSSTMSDDNGLFRCIECYNKSETQRREREQPVPDREDPQPVQPASPVLPTSFDEIEITQDQAQAMRRWDDADTYRTAVDWGEIAQVSIENTGQATADTSELSVPDGYVSYIANQLGLEIESNIARNLASDTGEQNNEG